MELFIISSVAAGICCGASLLTVFWNKCRRNSTCLTEFQKSKLQHEFKMFFDLDGDGVINWTDFELARNLTSDINRWKPESQKYLACENVYKNVWDSLRNYADKNNDERVTLDEWFTMWENLTQQMRKKDDSATSPEEKFPLWLYQYLLLRFNVLDRAGDGFIDSEEYEYVMSKYGVKGKDSRRAFLIFSEVAVGYRMHYNTYDFMISEFTLPRQQ